MATIQLPKITNQSQYFETLAVLPTAIAVANFDTGIIYYLNPLAEKLFGHSSESLEGKPQSILHVTEDNGEKLTSFQQHREIIERDGRVEGIEDIIFDRNGLQHHVEITANLVTLNGSRLMVGIFNSTEKRFQALKALQQKTDEIEAIFENSQVGIMLLKGYRIIDKANKRFAEILGYASPKEMEGLSVECLHLSKRRYETYGKVNYDTLAHRKNLHVDYQLRKKNGDAIWCRLSGMALDQHIPADLSKGVVWVVDDISDIKDAENTIKMERNLFRGGPTVIIQRHPFNGWNIQYVSKNVLNVLGYKQSELLKDGGESYSELIHPDDINRVRKEIDNYLINQIHTFELSYKLKIKTGEYRHFYDYSQVEYDEKGSVKSIYGYLLDMTEYLQAQEISSLLLSSANEGIFGVDKDGITTFINPAAAKMLGYQENELIGKSNHEIIHHSSESGEHIRHQECRMMTPIHSGEDVHVADEVLWRKDNSCFPVEYRSTPIYHEKDIVGAVITFHDISHRRAQEQKIEHLAFHDELTGLPNRRLFNDRMQEELKQEKRHTERATLMLLDVDHFKDINDTLGHPVGDKLLQEISHRIKHALRETDTFARLGGDEFAILMVREQGGVEATQVAERILELFKIPFEINSNKIPVGTSIGIAFCEPDFSSDDIIAQADIALYKAKDSGRNTFVFYQAAMSDKVKEDVEIIGELNQAILKKSFKTYYQPQIDTITQQVVGVEALIRWFPEDEHAKAMSSPAKFIPIAEERGLIQDITLWQITQIVEDIKSFRKAGLTGRVSINISGELLNHIENLVELLEVIERSDLNFHELEFEITETAYTNLKETETAVLESVREQGLELGIDDFGTGYSSLVSLRQFHSTHLKIDRAFIDEIDSNEDDYAIVSATISMAHGLGKRVIAEGVETKEQLRILKEMNCDVIQGYYFAKPMPLTQVCDYIANS